MLELEGLETKDHLLQIPEANSSKATEYIQYDMAVDKDGDNTIVTPYYINKVKAIYFKPEAQLRRQQFLTYDTAHVEFEMTPDAKYWMASPLQSVFAGDMYTVKNTGRQNTYASPISPTARLTTTAKPQPSTRKLGTRRSRCTCRRAKQIK